MEIIFLFYRTESNYNQEKVNFTLQLDIVSK